MVNINKLKAKMVKNGESVDDLVVKLSISRPTMYRRLKADSDSFTVRDINQLMNVLNLTVDEMLEIFYPLIAANK